MYFVVGKYGGILTTVYSRPLYATLKEAQAAAKEKSKHAPVGTFVPCKMLKEFGPKKVKYAHVYN